MYVFLPVFTAFASFFVIVNRLVHGDSLSLYHGVGSGKILLVGETTGIPGKIPALRILRRESSRGSLLRGCQGKESDKRCGQRERERERGWREKRGQLVASC